MLSKTCANIIEKKLFYSLGFVSFFSAVKAKKKRRKISERKNKKFQSSICILYSSWYYHRIYQTYWKELLGVVRMRKKRKMLKNANSAFDVLRILIISQAEYESVCVCVCVYISLLCSLCYRHVLRVQFGCPFFFNFRNIFISSILSLSRSFVDEQKVSF